MSTSRAIPYALVALLVVFASACGSHNDNNATPGGAQPTATPLAAFTATPTPAANCPLPATPFPTLMPAATPGPICTPAPTTPEADDFGAKLADPDEFAQGQKCLPPAALVAFSGVPPTPPPSFVISANSLPPVQAQGTAQNQGTPGSCEVWSAGYAMGSYTANVINQQPISDIANTVSPGFLYPWVLNHENLCCSSSTKAGDTLEYLVANTAPSLAQVPYAPVCSCLETVDINQTFQTDLSIGSWCYLPSNSDFSVTLQNIKGYIAQSRVVQTSIVVPWTFGSYQSGVFVAPPTCPSPAPTSPPTCQQYGSVTCVFSSKNPSMCAQHGIAIVGYDDTMQAPDGSSGAVLIMNSFGQEWGESGFMWMSYGTFGSIYLGGTLAFPPPKKPSSPFPNNFPRIWQWVEAVPGAPPRAHLIMEVAFSAAISDVTLRVSDGTHAVTHTQHGAFRHGYLYVTRTDGNQFETGVYEVDASDQNGALVGAVGSLDLDPASELPGAPLTGGITGTDGQPAIFEAPD